MNTTDKMASITLKSSGKKSPTKFLDFPREIRDTIYELLVPNRKACTCANPCSPKNWYLRDDAHIGGRCSPEFLRTCTQVHDEMMPLFWGNARFCARFSQAAFTFLDDNILYPSKQVSNQFFPDTIPRIKHLCLHIVLKGGKDLLLPSTVEPSDISDPREQLIEELVRLFSSSTTILRSLHIIVDYLSFTPPQRCFWNDMLVPKANPNPNHRSNITSLCDDPTALALALDMNVSPVRKLLVRGEVKVRAENVGGLSQTFATQNMMRRNCGKYFEALKQDITTNSKKRLA